jgi:hypothetical protein
VTVLTLTELRNKIYAYCVEDVFRGATAGGGWTFFDPRQYFSLTQVCKLLRDEYRPLYMADLNIQIWLPDLNAFLKTFLKTWSCFHKDARPRITIHIPNHMDPWVDLTPAMKLCKVAPGLEIRFQGRGQSGTLLDSLHLMFNKCVAALPSPATTKSILWGDKKLPPPPILWGDEVRPVPAVQGVSICFPGDRWHNALGSNIHVHLSFGKEEQRELMDDRELDFMPVIILPYGNPNNPQSWLKQMEINELLEGLGGIVGLTSDHETLLTVTAKVQE